MRVLRENRDSLMAMLEAFVYDPLISWRLLAQEGGHDVNSVSRVNSEDLAGQQRSPVDQMTASTSDITGADHSAFLTTGSLDLSPKRVPISSSIREVSALRRTMSHEKAESDEPLQENLNTR